MVYPLQQEGDGGKLERNPPTTMVVLALELVLESHASDRGQVGGQSRSNAEKELLVNKSPRRVACSQGNWLCAVRSSILYEDSTETLRDYLPAVPVPWRTAAEEVSYPTA